MTNVTTLKNAAERVIREYRDHDELQVEGAGSGIAVSLRSALALALDDLETALDVATDTAEVLASHEADAAPAPGSLEDYRQQGEAIAAAELPTFTVLEGDLMEELYGIEGIADAMDHEAGDAHLIMALRALAKHITAGLGSVPPDIERELERFITVRQ
jgi:hypothetical protein